MAPRQGEGKGSYATGERHGSERQKSGLVSNNNKSYGDGTSGTSPNGLSSATTTTTKAATATAPVERAPAALASPLPPRDKHGEIDDTDDDN